MFNLAKLYLVFPSFFCFVSLNSQQISFEKKLTTWSSILEKAKQADKPIFVDISTVWCGPCKWMDANVFVQPEVSSFYNKNFINIKIDAEEGMGIEFARKNKVTAFPTFLYFSKEGETLLAGYGAVKPVTFIENGKSALNNLREHLTVESIKQALSTNKYDRGKLLLFIKKLSSQSQPNYLIVEEYLSLLPPDSLNSVSVFNLVRESHHGKLPLQSKALDVLLRAYMKYPVKSGELMSPWNALKNRINTDIDSAGARVDIQWKEEITEIASRLDAKKEVQEREKAYLTSRFYAAARDSAHFIQSAEMYIKTYLLNLNKDSLYREENGVFQNILHKKFPEMKNTLAGGTNIQSFRNSYLGDSRLIIKQILDIIFLSNRFGNRGTIGSLNTKLITDGLLKLYAGNSIYVNPLLQESMKKSFESYFKNL